MGSVPTTRDALAFQAFRAGSMGSVPTTRDALAFQAFRAGLTVDADEHASVFSGVVRRIFIDENRQEKRSFTELTLE
jgi:hypothetical protein